MQLKLDFTLEGYEARRVFASKYIEDNIDRLTPDNIEMIGNYLLWGLQKETGEDFQIENKGPWKGRESKALSWEGLQEEAKEKGISPDTQIAQVGLRVTKKKLERDRVIERIEGQKEAWRGWQEEARRIAQETEPKSFEAREKEGRGEERGQEGKGQEGQSGELNKLRASDVATLISVAHPVAQTWLDLWKEIDETEYMVQSWELAHGKRRPDLPIRGELISRLAFNYLREGNAPTFREYLDQLVLLSQEWDARKFNKKKRELVSLRTEQYPLLDFIQGEPIQMHTNPGHYYYEPDYGILGFYPFTDRELLIEEIKEEHFSPEYADYFIKALQRVDSADEHPDSRKDQYIDFRSPEIIRQLLFNYHEIKTTAEEADLETRETVLLMLDYLDYYINECHFSDELILILEMKKDGKSNKMIIEELMSKHSLKYQENYISTIFTKRIIGSIIEQVNKHYKLIECILMGKNVFKRCTSCGKWLPRNTDYFNKRTSTSDGFFSYCKECKRGRK